MEKEELNAIGSKILEGYFDELLEVLDKRPDCLIPKRALYLIVCCCNTCNTNINSYDKLNEQKLILAVIGLSKKLAEVTADEYHTYLQSIYFICKFLIKKNYELVLELEAEILPTFIPKNLTEKQQSVYISICDLIRAEPVYVALKNPDVDRNKMVLMGNLLSKILLTSLNHRVFVYYVFRYGACLQHLKIDLEVLYQYFSSNIAAIKDFTKENILNGILELVRYGVFLYLFYLKNGNLEKAQQSINNTLNMIPKEGEWEDLKEIVNICRYVIDPNTSTDKFVTSKAYLMKSSKLYRKSENFISCCKLVSQAMPTFSNYCKFFDKKKIFSEPTKFMVLYEILNVLREVLSPPYDSCKKECNCLSKKTTSWTDPALCILSLYSLLSSVDTEPTYISKMKNLAEKYLKALVQRKSFNCQLYKKCWPDALPFIYNAEVILLRGDRFAETIALTNMTLKYDILLGEESDRTAILNTSYILHSLYSQQKKHREAMIWSAIEIINSKKSCRNEMFYRWIQIKAGCRDQIELQQFNILSIMDVIPRRLTRYISHVETKEDKIELLVSELETYYKKWKSKVPMMSAFRQLCQMADKSTIMKVFVEVFTDEDISVHEDVPKLLNDVFPEFENSQEDLDNTMKLYLSFYMFFQYKHQTIELIEKNFEEMTKVVKPKVIATIDVIIPADAYDRCDTVSVYENLKINSERMKSLVHSVNLLEDVVFSDLRQSMFGEIEAKKVYELTKNVAFEFILHSDRYNTLRSLFLAFRIAQLFDHKDLLLECSGYLLRHFNYSDLVEKMEEIASYLKSSNGSNKYLLQYYMNLSYFHMSIENIEVAYKHYEEAKKYWECLTGENDKNLSWLEISMELLYFKLMDVAKSTQFDTKLEFSYGPLMKVYKLVLNQYSSGVQWTTYSLIIVLESYVTLIKLYFDLKMPREVRCFGKHCLTLAQQYVIPVYSSRILSYLAHADLWGQKLDDCRVKLDGIADILLLNKTERWTAVPNSKNHLTVSPIKDIMEGVEQMRLDAPSQSAYNFKSGPASPVLQAQSYRCPYFMDHSLCECFHCTSIECQQVVLSYYHLEAVWYMHKGQITLADSFFKGVFKLHKSLLNKRDDISKVFHKYMCQYSKYCKLPKNECKFNFSRNDIRNITIYTSINYIKFLSLSGAQETAKKFCESALKKFKTTKGYYPHLYGELLLQKLGLICKPEVNIDVNMMKFENSANNDSDVRVRTPEPREPNIKIRRLNSPKVRKILPPKVIQFNLTDSSSTLTPSKTTNDTTGITKTPKVRVLPPSLRSINTPNLKTPKKSIFNDLKISTPSINQQNITPENDERQKSPLSEISNPQIIISKDPATELEEKTKLLTARLRQKQVSENNERDINEIVKETDTQRIRRSKRDRT